LKKNFIKFEHFEKKEDYIRRFENNKVLEDLATTPFTLRLIITILPEFGKNSDENKPITKFNIYNTFI
jgi:hypothetical protein